MISFQFTQSLAIYSHQSTFAIKGHSFVYYCFRFSVLVWMLEELLCQVLVVHYAPLRPRAGMAVLQFGSFLWGGMGLDSSDVIPCLVELDHVDIGRADAMFGKVWRGIFPI